MVIPTWPHQRLPRYMSQQEARHFFAVIDSPRDRALFALIYHHGLRVGEVSFLSRGDVDLKRARIRIRRSKGGAWGEQFLFKSSLLALRSYLGEAPLVSDAPLFPGRHGPLRKRQIQALFCRFRDRAKLQGHYTAHSLRHSIATHLLDAGASLEFVQDHLGHQNIRSTSIYARITDRHREALVRRFERSPWIVQPDQRSRRSEPPAPPAPAP
jgi:integrase